MHNLLELIKKEQDIYNICFHELIRQVGPRHGLILRGGRLTLKVVLFGGGLVYLYGFYAGCFYMCSTCR